MSNSKANKINPIFTLIAAILIQLCLGVAYIWSVFQTGIAQTIFEGNNANASLSYSILLALLTVGSVAGGTLARKIPLRSVVMIGGIILSLGFFIASFTTPDFPQLLWLSYGVMGGIGMGFVYSTTIACVQKLFPTKKGLVTGLVVAALGLGGVVFTPIVETLITTFGGQGQGELMSFRVISIVFLVICTVGSMFMYMPEEKDDANGGSDNDGILQIIRMPKLYLITASMMLACMGGLMMIGFAKPIAVGRGMVETATVGVLMISIFNAVGRLVCGIVSDKIGRSNTLLILMLGSTVMSLLVTFATGYWIFVLIGCIGFFYGGLLSTYPSLTAEILGAKNVATKYGVVLLGFGAAAIISSYIAGYFLDLAGGDMDKMFPAFAIASACSFVSIGLILILKKVSKAKQ